MIDSIIAASLEAVFRVISSPRSKLLWVPAIGCVEIESDRISGLGTQYLTSAGKGPLDFIFRVHIIERVKYQPVSYKGRSLWDKFKTEVNIDPCEGGTRLHTV